MKQLYDLINEKLQINKNSKSQPKKYKPQDVLNWLGITDKCKRWEILYDDVDKWLTKDIKNDELELCADPETVNEWCQHELDKTHKVYTCNDEDIELKKNSHIFCNITSYGTLYVIDRDDILPSVTIPYISSSPFASKVTS